MIAVIDANIAMALMLDLAYSQSARKAVATATSIIAPDLIIHETANALWKIATAQPVMAGQCEGILQKMPFLFDEIVDGRQIAVDAYKLALSLEHPAYDCFYVALARTRGATLITADKKLAAAINGHQVKSSIPVIEVR